MGTVKSWETFIQLLGLLMILGSQILSTISDTHLDNFSDEIELRQRIILNTEHIILASKLDSMNLLMGEGFNYTLGKLQVIAVENTELHDVIKQYEQGKLTENEYVKALYATTNKKLYELDLKEDYNVDALYEFRQNPPRLESIWLFNLPGIKHITPNFQLETFKSLLIIVQILGVILSATGYFILLRKVRQTSPKDTSS